MFSTRKRSTGAAVGLDPLESRLLLSVTGTASSKAMTIVYSMTAWKDSGVVNGVIAKDLYSSDNPGVNSVSHADAYSEGTDPGWYGAGVNGKLTADSHTASTITGPGGVATAGSGSLVDYDVSIRQIKPLPKAFVNTIFNVPVTSNFDTQATIVGNPGLTVEQGIEQGTAESYVEVCLSDGSQYLKADTKLDWTKDQARADGNGEVTQIDARTFSNTITYWASTGNSDYLSICMNAAGSSMAGLTQPGAVNTYAYTYVTGIQFDQAAFNATQGAGAFPLSDYFQLVYGFDPTKGPRVKMSGATCSTPAMAAASQTGSAGGATGDLTPTFTGQVLSGGKPLKSGVAILYVDGAASAQGLVTNGVYHLTSSQLSAGTHVITVSAGASALLMGPQSGALTITIDTNLPRGDTATVTIGGSAPHSLYFVDGDGTKAMIVLSAGTGTLTFLGDDLGQVSTRNLLTVTGTNLHISSLDVSGDTSRGALGFACAQGSRTGNNLIDVGEMSFTNAVNIISAGGVNLLGNLTVNGAVQSLTLNSTPGATHAISAVSIGALKVNGDLSGTAITLSQPVVTGQTKVMALGTFTVGGTMAGSTIDSRGHIGRVTVGRLIDSSIFAGVDTQRNALGVLPDEALDFSASARLDSLTVLGLKNQPTSFQNSFVAASSLGIVNLLDLPTDTSAAGGVAGHQLLTSYTRRAGKKIALFQRGPVTTPRVLETVNGYVARVV